MRLEELARLINGFKPDLLAVTSMGRYAAESGRSLVEDAGVNAHGMNPTDESAYAGADAVLTLTVKPGAACVPPDSADQVSLEMEVRLVRSRDRAVLLHKEIGGSGLKRLQGRTVTGEAQYAPVYQEWIKPYSEQAWREATEAWYRAE